MSLLHALIAQESAVLAEHDHDGSNKYSQAVQTILTKLPPGSSKLTYSAEDILIHYVKSGSGLVSLVVAEDVAGRRMPFAFLHELTKRFESTFSTEEVQDALPYGMASFNGDIAKLMKEYVDNPPRDRIHEAQQELDSTRAIMTKNIDAVLSRGERIELLVDKTDGLSMQARAFRKRATVVRRKMWWKNIKITILLGAVMLLLIYALAANFCGLSLTHCSS